MLITNQEQEQAYPEKEILKAKAEAGNILHQIVAFESRMSALEDLAETTRRLLNTTESRIDCIMGYADPTKALEELAECRATLNECVARLRVCQIQNSELNLLSGVEGDPGSDVTVNVDREDSSFTVHTEPKKLKPTKKRKPGPTKKQKQAMKKLGIRSRR